MLPAVLSTGLSASGLIWVGATRLRLGARSAAWSSPSLLVACGNSAATPPPASPSASSRSGRSLASESRRTAKPAPATPDTLLLALCVFHAWSVAAVVAAELRGAKTSGAGPPLAPDSGVSGGVHSGIEPGTGALCSPATLGTAPICGVGCISTLVPSCTMSSGRSPGARLSSVAMLDADMERVGEPGWTETGWAKVDAGEAGMFVDCLSVGALVWIGVGAGVDC